MKATMTMVSVWSFAVLGFSALPGGCDSAPDNHGGQPADAWFNSSHLDHLGEEIARSDGSYRIIHIYSEAPDYGWVGDADEGAAALDDAARAAVVYLHHYEYTGDRGSAEKARQLLRFIMYMQRGNGLFYNFVWNADLDINETHPNSRADAFEWWAARAVWALGTGVRVLGEEDSTMVDAMAERVRLTYPHLRSLLAHYGEYTNRGGRSVPLWLIGETGADATSELLLGLVAMQSARPDAEVSDMIARFAEGIAHMQYGSMNSFPYGAHASWIDQWHGWGNSQTQALAEAGYTASAEFEARHFYPRLLVEGWMHSFSLDDPGSVREFEQIAYAVRAVSVGLIRLFEATGDASYAKMAGLAASWFTGNNVAGEAMYDHASGRGFDGIGQNSVNRNAGAESTIEALFAVLEVDRHPQARQWLTAKAGEVVHVTRDGQEYAYRVFTSGSGGSATRIGVVMNLTDERLSLLENSALDQFLAG
jgi:hypothetical protein